MEFCNMKNRNIGAEIFDGLCEIKQNKRGLFKLRTTELLKPSEPKVIRSKLKLT